MFSQTGEVAEIEEKQHYVCALLRNRSENGCLGIEFRTGMFNFTNTPNFGRPNSPVNMPQAGQINSAASPRRIQFGLKFVYWVIP